MYNFIYVQLIYPALALIYILAPYSLIGRLLKTPCVKFVAHAASYMSFLGLIVIQGQVETRKLCLSRVRDYAALSAHYHTYRHNLSADLQALDDMCIRNNSVTLTEGCIFIWISGMAWQACKEIHRDGAVSYFRNIYNSMDFFMLQFYMASFALRRVTEKTVQSSLKYFELGTSWEKLIVADREASYLFYWLNADRFYWNAFDPVNVYEALFAVGNILNFARLFHLLAINELLGPMLISLERMIKDVMKFMVTFVPIFLAFMVGMYNLYWYYDPSVRGIVELTNHNIKTRAEEGFGR